MEIQFTQNQDTTHCTFKKLDVTITNASWEWCGYIVSRTKPEICGIWMYMIWPYMTVEHPPKKGTWRPFHSQPRYVSLSKSNPTSPGKVSGARFGFGAPNLMHMFNLHVDYWLQICNPHDPILQVVLYILISHSLKAGLWSLVNWLCQLIMGVVGGQTSTRLALGNGGSQPSVGFWGKACPTSSERQYACSILLYIYIIIKGSWEAIFRVTDDFYL